MRLILSGAYFFINKNLCDLDFFRNFADEYIHFVRLYS